MHFSKLFPKHTLLQVSSRRQSARWCPLQDCMATPWGPWMLRRSSLLISQFRSSWRTPHVRVALDDNQNWNALILLHPLKKKKKRYWGNFHGKFHISSNTEVNFWKLVDFSWKLTLGVPSSSSSSTFLSSFYQEFSQYCWFMNRWKSVHICSNTQVHPKWFSRFC